jgi:RNA polymerase sigma factor (sigma-70 family)
LRFARHEGDAKDIFQEAFLKVYDNLERLKEPGSLDAWVKSIVVRTAINFYPANLGEREDIHEKGYDPKGDDVESIIGALAAEQLLVYINRMPDGYRKVFNLYVIDGYKHREIAEMLGISESTSKTQLRDAKTFLKKELSRMGITKSYCYE